MNTIVVVAERQDEFTLFSSNFSHLPVHFSWNKTEKRPITFDTYCRTKWSGDISGNHQKKKEAP